MIPIKKFEIKKLNEQNALEIEEIRRHL